MFSRKTEPVGCLWTDIRRGLLSELAHMVVEAEKTHNMLSASWRPRKAGGGASVQVWRPENQEGQCLRAGGEGRPSSREESDFTLPLLFCSIQAPGGLHDAHCLGESDLLCSVYWSKCSRNTLIDTTGNNVLPALWASLSPAKLTHKISQVDTLH